MCRIGVAGIKVDGGNGQFVSEKTGCRFNAPVTNRQQTIACLNGLARRGGACNARVRSNEMTGTLWDNSFSAVQRCDLYVKSFGEFHDLLGDAESDGIQIQ